MKVLCTRGAFGVVLWALMSMPAFAQHEGHQMPGAGSSASPASLSACAQGSQGVTRNIDALSGRLDEARQTNDAAKMRAAVADLQVALAQMKTQLADCVALAGEAGGGAMAGMDHSKMQMAPGTPVTQPGSPASAPGTKTATPMSGMDHSKMQVAPKSTPAPATGSAAPAAKPAAPMAGMDHSKMAGAPAPKTGAAEPSKMAGMDHSKMGSGEKAAPAGAATSSKAGQSPSMVFILRTQPAPPRSGKNDFEVTVKDADGKPIADAEVSLAFYMPPMPSMNMPEMRNTVKLTSAGDGNYKGSGTIGMTGDWDVTVTVSRTGRELDSRKMRLTVK
jgi:hypothetical protein